MARKISSRLIVRGQLVAESPLHVGSGAAAAGVDLTLARDGRGRLYVPGTGLAGALRGWMAGHLDETTLNALWGYQPEAQKKRRGQDEGHASFVLVEDGLVVTPANLPPEVRDGVGIDRAMGAAAPSIKYTRAVLPRGARIGFDLQLELPRGEEALGRALLSRLVQALVRGEVRLGAAQTRGLGRVRLAGKGTDQTPHIEEQQLDSRSGMLQALRRQSGTTQGFEQLAARPLPPGRAVWAEPPKLDVAVDWTAELPVMSKAEAEGLAVDMLPLVTTGPDGKDVWLLLAGAGIKGALRCQAERILRTLRGTTVPDEADPRKRFLRQVAEVDPLLDVLFGSARARNGEDDAGDTPGAAPSRRGPRPGRAALAVVDCHGGRPPAQPGAKLQPLARLDQWEAIGRASQAELAEKLGGAGLDAHCTPATGPRPPGLQQAFHIAVDRWTGGVAQGALYSMLEPCGLAWEPIRLELDLGRITEADRLPAVALLLLVLQDLAAGRIPLGFGGQRGLGALRVRSITCAAVGHADARLAELGQLFPQADGKLPLPEALRDDLHQAWTSYLDRPRPPSEAAATTRPAPAAAATETRRSADATQEVFHG